ncbi:hypothetical protein JVT61DRAFT_14269 [Boletus reticuloceps]|nr:hypothetical protein JVT61DRAFT_14269 [Boletus reticuloceps]
MGERSGKSQQSAVIDKGKRKANPDLEESTAQVEGAGQAASVSGSREPKRRKTVAKQLTRYATPSTVQSLLTGITCPSDTPALEWPNIRVMTRVPWYSDNDRKIVERMSMAPRAQDCTYGADRPMVIELQYDGGNAQDIHSLTKGIEDAISKGCAVLVRGWEPTPALEFTLSDIQLFRPTVSQPVVVQDDDERGQHRDMTLEGFIRMADDAGACMNLLDLPNYQPDVPIFIR